MLERKFAKLGLTRFDYKRTGWYQTIRSENRAYKHSLVRNVLLAVLGVVFCLVIIAVAEGRFGLLPNYLVVMAFAGILLFLHQRTRHYRVMVYASLLVPVAGLLVALYVPGAGYTHWLVLSAYPILCMQLRGSRRGALWVAGFLAFFIAAYILAATRVIPPWVLSIPVTEGALAVATSLTVTLFAMNAEFRQESMIARLTDRFVLDDATGLPCKDVLMHSIDPSVHYLFAIIKIENYSDLVALFGYEFSDTITQFASRKLVKFEDRFKYKTYQLKYNEYGILIEMERGLAVSESAQHLSGIIKSLEIESLPWERDRINLVYRVGATVISPGDEISPLSKADIALKKAERGHSSITIYDGDNDERESAYDHVMKFTELINNRENDSFRVVFQPIFNGDGTEIAWYEALLRIRRQDGSFGSIYPYLAIAKSTGFYRYLTEFVIRKTAEAICMYDVDISVNIAIHDIVRPEFIQLVDEAYGKIRGKSGRIIFEILESDELVELDKCLWFIEYIGRYGFKIAIDDFGTGYSNYCSLINLPIDIVKIDGSLITKIRHDENAKILVEGIVNFCERSNKKTVAEFVEDAAVLDSLKSMKIDYLQGYYLAKPDAIMAET